MSEIQRLYDLVKQSNGKIEKSVTTDVVFVGDKIPVGKRRPTIVSNAGYHLSRLRRRGQRPEARGQSKVNLAIYKYLC